MWGKAASRFDMPQGVRLTGWYVPESVEDKVLHVIVAVECANCSLAPSLVALVVWDLQPSGEVRVASVRKHLPADGTGVAVGLETPLSEAGKHDLHVMVFAVGSRASSRTCFLRRAEWSQGPRGPRHVTPLPLRWRTQLFGTPRSVSIRDGGHGNPRTQVLRQLRT
jgi:hypothetical protein